WIHSSLFTALQLCAHTTSLFTPTTSHSVNASTVVMVGRCRCPRMYLAPRPNNKLLLSSYHQTGTSSRPTTKRTTPTNSVLWKTSEQRLLLSVSAFFD
uniref:Secreted protein n=1 Tax=Mesocestoides corti TaxID=53468 RepID=A0A5K3G501_MESCO